MTTWQIKAKITAWRIKEFMTVIDPCLRRVGPSPTKSKLLATKRELVRLEKWDGYSDWSRYVRVNNNHIDWDCWSSRTGRPVAPAPLPGLPTDSGQLHPISKKWQHLSCPNLMKTVKILKRGSNIDVSSPFQLQGKGRGNSKIFVQFNTNDL